MIHLVLVSHSATLARGIVELTAGMTPYPETVLPAAGIDDPDAPLGTDAVKIAAVLEQADNPDGTLILVDLGSALLSAETALELVSPDIAARCRISAAPLIEGALSAAVAAAGGADLATVAREAEAALTPKQTALGAAENENTADRSPASAYTPEMPHCTVTVKNRNGLHARPAARLVEALSAFSARLILVNAQQTADPHSLNQIIALQIRAGERITLYADGEDSAAALQAFQTLADNGFGEEIPPQSSAQARCCAAPVFARTVTAPALHKAASPQREDSRPASSDEKSRLQNAATEYQDTLTTLSRNIGTQLGQEYGEIFAAQHMMLEELAAEALQTLEAADERAETVWQNVCNRAAANFRQSENPYLRERSADIEDLKTHLLALLNGEPARTPPETAHILIAGDIYPGEAVALGAGCRAVVLAQGSDCSHAAILLQALHIPLFIQAGEQLLSIENGQILNADCSTGNICY